ncbi:hypothetical protein Lal_00039401, partial [Lupinus albus]
FLTRDTLLAIPEVLYEKLSNNARQKSTSSSLEFPFRIIFVSCTTHSTWQGLSLLFGIHLEAKKHIQREAMASKKGICREMEESDQIIRQAKEVRNMICSFVHVHRGTILQGSLPRMKEFVIILKPTQLQKKLLEDIQTKRNRLCHRNQHRRM